MEYRVRRVDNDTPAKLESALNEDAADGWRLVSTASGRRGDATWVYLFLERESAPRDPLEETVAAMETGERRELMDVAVALADAQQPVE